MPAARPKILYVVHRVPFPPDKGDRIRAYNLVCQLSRQADIHLVCLADEPVAPGTEENLGRVCDRFAIHPVGFWRRRLGMAGSLLRGESASQGAFASGALGSTIDEWTRHTRFDAVLTSASSMVPYLRGLRAKGVPCVIDLVDVDSEKWLEYSRTKRGPLAWLYHLEHRRLRRLEEQLTSWARAVTLVSEAEADIYRRFGKPGNVAAVANGVDLDYFKPPLVSAESGCVFVGALDYYPNVEGICRFGREIWPQIANQRASITLKLVGRQPTSAVRHLTRIPGVKVPGQVPDVRPYLAASAIVVVPLRIARGMQNKVLEAMAMGKVVVASPEALQGIDATPGVHVIKASTQVEWIDAVVELDKNPALRRRIGTAARQYVEENHRWTTCLEPMSELLGIGPVHVESGILTRSVNE
jgi:sugar transferase (PEP-CTERM/EpsH1 system associated)